MAHRWERLLLAEGRNLTQDDSPIHTPFAHNEAVSKLLAVFLLFSSLSERGEERGW